MREARTEALASLPLEAQKALAALSPEARQALIKRVTPAASRAYFHGLVSMAEPPRHPAGKEAAKKAWTRNLLKALGLPSGNEE